MPQNEQCKEEGKGWRLSVEHCQRLVSKDRLFVSEWTVPTVTAVPRRFKSSRSRDLSGETLISVEEWSRTGSRLVSSLSCLIGISETEGVTSCSMRKLLVAMLLLESADRGDTEPSAVEELSIVRDELPFTWAHESPVIERQLAKAFSPCKPRKVVFYWYCF